MGSQKIKHNLATKRQGRKIRQGRDGSKEGRKEVRVQMIKASSKQATQLISDTCVRLPPGFVFVHW